MVVVTRSHLSEFERNKRESEGVGQKKRGGVVLPALMMRSVAIGVRDKRESE